MIKINSTLKLDEAELNFTFARSSGPGGQNVNKLNTKALMKWNIDDCPSLPYAVKARFKEKYPNRLIDGSVVAISSDKFRSQEMNVKSCMDKLCELLLSVAVAPKKRRATKPTRASKEKRINSKKMRSSTKKNRQKVSY